MRSEDFVVLSIDWLQVFGSNGVEDFGVVSVASWDPEGVSHA